MHEVWCLPSKFKERSCWVTHRWLDEPGVLAHGIFKGRLTCASVALVNYSGSGSRSTNNKFPKLRDPGIRVILRSAQLYFHHNTTECVEPFTIFVSIYCCVLAMQFYNCSWFSARNIAVQSRNMGKELQRLLASPWVIMNSRHPLMSLVFQDRLAFCSMQDPGEETKSGFNTVRGVAVWGRPGKTEVGFKCRPENGTARNQLIVSHKEQSVWLLWTLFQTSVFFLPIFHSFFIESPCIGQLILFNPNSIISQKAKKIFQQ